MGRLLQLRGKKGKKTEIREKKKGRKGGRRVGNGMLKSPIGNHCPGRQPSAKGRVIDNCQTRGMQKELSQ